MKIGIDVMGADSGPKEILKGVVLAAKEFQDEIIVIGNVEEIKNGIGKDFPRNISVCPSQEVIEMTDIPTVAVKHKKNSSIVVGMTLLLEKKIDALVSAGNSGAIVVAASTILHPLYNISKPAISVTLPTLRGVCMLLDVGANVECKPRHFLQFAIMGSVYMREMFGIDRPRVGILTIGEEDTKGNELVLGAHDILKNFKSINFVGNIEGGDIPQGLADVVVCDGFVGNIVLKFGEGIAEMIISLIKEQMKKHPVTFLSIPFLWSAIKDLRKKLDYTEYGGAPLLGTNGICIICHGKSNYYAIKNAIRVAKGLFLKNINEKISMELVKCQSV